MWLTENGERGTAKKKEKKKERQQKGGRDKTDSEK